MEIMKIGVAIKDCVFADALIRKLSLICSNLVFFKNDILNEDVDLVIKDSEPACENEVELVTNKGDCCYDHKPYRVYKYMDAHEMIKTLYFIFFQITGIDINYNYSETCKFIAVTSYGGGFGATSISMGISRTMNYLYGDDVLYVNLSYVNDSMLYIGEYEQINTSMLAYYLKYKEDFSIDTFIGTGIEYDYLQLPVNNNIENIDVKSLINKACKFKSYKVIIFDIGNNYCINNLKLIRRCDALVIVDSYERRLPKAYKENILNNINYQKKEIVHVKNKAVYEPADEDILVLSMDEEAFVVENEIKIDLHRNYGVELERITKVVEGKIYDE